MDNNSKSFSAVIAETLWKNYYIRDIHRCDYEKYISLYEKQKFKGDIELETEDFFASYYITNENGEIICCKAIAPYTHLELNVCNNFTLYTYSESSLQIKEIKNSFINAIFNDFSLFQIVLILIPLILISIIAAKFGAKYIIIFVIYLPLIFYCTDYKARYIRKLEKKRDEFLSAYYKGRYDK